MSDAYRPPQNPLSPSRTDQSRPRRGAIEKFIQEQEPHVQVGIRAYRTALNQRNDWHKAVTIAINAAVSALNKHL